MPPLLIFHLYQTTKTTQVVGETLQPISGKFVLIPQKMIMGRVVCSLKGCQKELHSAYTSNQILKNKDTQIIHNSISPEAQSVTKDTSQELTSQ